MCSQRLDGSDNKQKLLATTLLGMAAGALLFPNTGGEWERTILSHLYCTVMYSFFQKNFLEKIADVCTM